jgi:hypothetical protein
MLLEIYGTCAKGIALANINKILIFPYKAGGVEYKP